jgi:hypothetical protein
MDLTLLVYGSVGLGVLLLVSNFVDFSYLLSKVLFRTKTVKVNVVQQTNQEQDFLQIVSLWYQLKDKCDKFNLHVASEKLNEVFPLLNGILKDETAV